MDKLSHFDRMNNSINGVRCCGGIVPFEDFMFFEKIKPSNAVQFAHVKDGDMDTYIIRLWNRRSPEKKEARGEE